MPDILHDFVIYVSMDRVFDAFTQPERLDQWWTMRSSGRPRVGADYELWFGPAYDWRAAVTKCEPHMRFELEMVKADADWLGTSLGFTLERRGGDTAVQFYHREWPEANEHFRVSSYCWAMYLRLLKRYLEHGETVPYELRLEV